MAQGDVLLNDDGTIALDGSGNVRLVDVDSDCPECCDSCTDDGDDCNYCDDVNPSQYQATFNSISLCGCEVGGTDYSFEFEAKGGFDPNTAFTLTQKVGSACVWEVLQTSKMDLKSYFSSETCSGVPDETTDCDIRVVLTRSATAWSLGMFVEPDGGIAVALFEQFVAVTADVDGAVQLCGTITNNFSNAHTSCSGIVDETGHATGGTATVICL